MGNENDILDVNVACTVKWRCTNIICGPGGLHTIEQLYDCNGVIESDCGCFD